MTRGESNEHEPRPVEPMSPAALLVEKLLQHSPGVEAAKGKLAVAEKLDAKVRNKEGNHPLTRRFVVSSEGTEAHPFRHKRVVLEPIHTGRANQFQLNGLTLRFGLEREGVSDSAEFSGVILVTFGYQEGHTAEFVLTDSSWEPIVDAGDLLIKNGVLKGVQEPLADSPFNQNEFEMLLTSMEPALQTNASNPAA